MKRAAATILVVLAIESPALAQVASLDQEEGIVLAAAISQTRLNGREAWLLIYDETASFRCDSKQKAFIRLADGCSGMRTSDESIEDVLLRLRSEFPQINDEVLAAFRARATSPAKVAGPLPLPTKQFVWGHEPGTAQPPPEMGNPALAITVSRVGFNKAHTQALAYIGTASWSGVGRAYGEYVLLSKANEKWTVAGKSRMWDMGR